MKLEKNLKYEAALDRLQEIVNLLERKEIKIDDLSDKVKEAKALVEFCREKLDETEEEINKIIEPTNSDEEDL